MEKNEQVIITRPFVSWYSQGVFIVDISGVGSVQVCKLIESDDASDKTWLANVYVSKPFRCRGIATRLINAAKEYCRNNSIGALYLWCVKDMIKFYEQFGFETIGEVGYDSKGTRLYSMVCVINSK